MTFGTIVFLLFMCVSIHTVFGNIGEHGECRRQNMMLHNKVSWLYGVNKNLLNKIHERKDCKYKSTTYADGKTFEDGCNACVCNNGIVACTDHTCNKGCEYKNVTYGDGETFDDECNTCVCNNGIVVCTDNMCDQDCEYKNVTYVDEETFDDECNACVCKNGIVTCTDNLCNKECSHKGVTYADGETFEVDCNYFVCNNGIVACTNYTCNQGCRYNGVNHLHGDTFASADGCYECTCQHGCLECENRICASIGQLGPFGPTTRSAPTADDTPGGIVSPGANNPPWEAVDGDVTTYVRATDEYGTQPWWMMEWPCLETISAVVLTSSLDGDADADFSNLVITVDGVVCGNVGDSPGAGMTVTVTCDMPLTGRSLKILKEDEEGVMRIAEVVPIAEALSGGEFCDLVPLQ